MIRINHQVEPTSEIEHHLANTVLGNPGKLRYRHVHIRERIRKTSHLRFVTLRFRKQLIGIVGVIHRTVQINGQPTPVSYIRYLSLRTRLGGKNMTRKRRVGNKNTSSLRADHFTRFLTRSCITARYKSLWTKLCLR